MVFYSLVQDVLSEPENDVRFTRLREFFLVLGSPGHISESVGLMYTIKHLWAFLYSVALVPPLPRVVRTVSFLMKAGIFQCMMRILERCSHRKFLLMDYNRLVPYPLMESIFMATHFLHYRELTAHQRIEDAKLPNNLFVYVHHSLV